MRSDLITHSQSLSNTEITCRPPPNRNGFITYYPNACVCVCGLAAFPRHLFLHLKPSIQPTHTHTLAHSIGHTFVVGERLHGPQTLLASARGPSRRTVWPFRCIYLLSWRQDREQRGIGAAGQNVNTNAPTHTRFMNNSARVPKSGQTVCHVIHLMTYRQSTHHNSARGSEPEKCVCVDMRIMRPEMIVGKFACFGA